MGINSNCLDNNCVDNNCVDNNCENKNIIENLNGIQSGESTPCTSDEEILE